MDITGDIDLRAKVALDDWTPAATSNLISKNQAGAVSYYLNVQTTGALRLMISLNGTAETIATSTAVNTIPDGTTKWVRATRVAATGVVQFFTSDDGLTWTQLGTDVSTTSGNIAATTAFLEIGTTGFGGGAGFRGKFFRAQVLNGINGTLALDANFESSITSLNQASFTESSTNGATVTINRSGSTYRSAGVIDAGYLYPGATNTFSNSTTDFLNFGATDSFTLIAIIRGWSGTTGYRNILSKNAPFAVVPGYHIYTGDSSVVYAAGIGDGTTRTFSNSLTVTTGALTNLNLIRNVSTDRLTLSTTAAVTDVTTGSLASFANFFVGGSGLNAPDMEFIAAAVFRTVLTAAQIRQVTNYFINREAYL